mgnify:CR=1 FL=1
MTMATYPGGRVSPEFACPLCGEAAADRLVWQEDDETLRCTMCGTEFVLTVADEENASSDDDGRRFVEGHDHGIDDSLLAACRASQ